MTSTQKIRNSKGEIYDSCPDIDGVLEILDNYADKILPEDILEISLKLERIRKINDALRQDSELPYSITAILKTLRLKFKDDAGAIKILNDTINIYI